MDHVSLEVAASRVGKDDVKLRYDGYHGHEEKAAAAVAQGDVQLTGGVARDEVEVITG